MTEISHPPTLDQPGDDRDALAEELGHALVTGLLVTALEYATNLIDLEKADLEQLQRLTATVDGIVALIPMCGVGGLAGFTAEASSSIRRRTPAEA